MQQHITKGREIFVGGKLEVNDKTGYISLIADHIELLRRPMSKSGRKVEQEEEKKLTGQKKPSNT